MAAGSLEEMLLEEPFDYGKHYHRMNNHLANDCWGADTWSRYLDSSPETSVSVYG